MNGNSLRAPVSPRVRQGQQIWCDARADGHSPDERDATFGAQASAATVRLRGGLGCVRPESGNFSKKTL